jgi:hypothetical protein
MSEGEIVFLLVLFCFEELNHGGYLYNISCILHNVFASLSERVLLPSVFHIYLSFPGWPRLVLL